MNINTKYNYPQTNPNFKACKVRKIKPTAECGDVVFYNNMTAMLKKPAPLFEGLKKLLNATLKNISIGFAQWTCLDELDLPKLRTALQLLPNHLFQQRTLFGVIGTGINNLALQIDNNEVLCISDNMSVFKEREWENFDLPILQEGRMPEDFELGWFIRRLGTPVNKTELKKLAAEITKKGYKLDDWRCEQACKVDGKIYLIDFECAYKD